MANTYLGRDDAPIEAATWKLLDDVTVQAAKSQLSGCRIPSYRRTLRVWS